MVVFTARAEIHFRHPVYVRNPSSVKRKSQMPAATHHGACEQQSKRQESVYGRFE